MLVVAGLSLKNLKPRVWDPQSPYHLPSLRAVMVSYAEFHRMPARRRKAMEQGIHAYLGAPPEVQIYLDNGAFSFLRQGGEVPRADYEAFVAHTKPDWYAIPQDYIPTPQMSREEQLTCFEQTMAVNREYHFDGYVPVVHIGALFPSYLESLGADASFAHKPGIALGGIVPNLLRAPKAMSYSTIIDNLIQIRQHIGEKRLHVFGIGGTATLHLAALLRVNSVDSSGWRNRAARGLVQLPGCGDRMVAKLGNWRGRSPNLDEWAVLEKCSCPPCRQCGVEGLQVGGLEGFSNRASHNLWTLLEESNEIDAQLAAGMYDTWYQTHVNNSVYRPLIEMVLRKLREG